MISTLDALILISTGVFLSLVCVTYGILAHMRYLDRRLIKPVPKSTQQLPAVKP